MSKPLDEICGEANMALAKLFSSQAGQLLLRPIRTNQIVRWNISTDMIEVEFTYASGYPRAEEKDGPVSVITSSIVSLLQRNALILEQTIVKTGYRKISFKR